MAYDTIVVPEDTTYTFRIGDDDALGPPGEASNILLDQTASGASARILTGEFEWTIENIGWKGVMDLHSGSGGYHIFPETTGGVGTIQNTYISGDSTNECGGIMSQSYHSGELWVRNSYIDLQSDNAAYCSGPGRHPDDGGGQGPIHFRDCYHRDCTVAQFRTGGPDSSMKRCVSVVNDPDCTRPLYPTNYNSRYARGLANIRQDCYVENCSFWQASDDCQPGSAIECRDAFSVEDYVYHPNVYVDNCEIVAGTKYSTIVDNGGSAEIHPTNIGSNPTITSLGNGGVPTSPEMAANGDREMPPPLEIEGSASHVSVAPPKVQAEMNSVTPNITTNKSAGKIGGSSLRRSSDTGKPTLSATAKTQYHEEGTVRVKPSAAGLDINARDPPWIDTGVYESFEDGDIAEYEGDTASHSVVTSPVFDGTYALQAVADSDNWQKIVDFDARGPQRGTTFDWYHHVDDAFADVTRCFFAISGTATDYTGYQVRNNLNGAAIQIERHDSGSSEIWSQGIDRDTAWNGTWLRGKLDFGHINDDELTYRLFDSSDNMIAELTVTDEMTYDTGGIGFGHSQSSQSTPTIDFMTDARPRTSDAIVTPSTASSEVRTPSPMVSSTSGTTTVRPPAAGANADSLTPVINAEEAVILESFEHNNLSSTYSGETANYSITTTPSPIRGHYALQRDAVSSTGAQSIYAKYDDTISKHGGFRHSNSRHGEVNTEFARHEEFRHGEVKHGQDHVGFPSAGNSFSYHLYSDNTGSQATLFFLYNGPGGTGSAGWESTYYTQLRWSDGTAALGAYDETGTGTDFDTASVTLPTSEWVECRVSVPRDPTSAAITFDIYDKNATLLASLTGTDTVTQNGLINGGIGWRTDAGDNQQIWADYVHRES